MSTTNVLEIARLPLKTVQSAFWEYRVDPHIHWKNKADAVHWLAEQVDAGGLNLDNIRNVRIRSDLNGASGAIPQPSTAALDVSAINVQLDDLGKANISVRDEVQKLRDGVKNAILRTEGRVTTEVTALNDRITHEFNRLNDSLTVVAKQSKPDTSQVQYEVAKAVRDAFEPFLQVVQDAGAQQAVAEASSVIPVGRRTVYEVFGITVCDIKGNDLMVDVWNHPDAPAVDPDFIWTDSILRHLILAERHGDNLWFGGEKGTGKSETARQFAARTGRAFKRINFHKHTSAEEYVGAVGLVDGETVFQPKDFLQAYTSPSTVILLDEVTNADPGELAPLNGFLEPNACVSFGGKTHRRAPGVLVFAADNTFGNGDDTGRHVGTRLQNSALIDRFARVIPFTFLPQDKEIEAIVSRTGCNVSIASHVLSAVTVARQRVQEAEIVDAPSIRSAMAFIRALSVLPPADAWQTAVVARQPSESHAELNSIYTACINETFIKDNI